MIKEKRLILVSNRLPVSIQENGDQTTVRPASGGLVSAISSYLEKADEFSEVLWAGVPGCSLAAWHQASESLPSSRYQYLPVPVYREQYDHYYNGFSNSVLWPLFHYFPSYVEYQAEDFSDYLQVNAHFAELLERHCRPNDVVWIHDYHLLPLASMLRKAIPGITIGFFLHIPFPSFELVRTLPRAAQEAILDGLMGADLVGFHTIEYAEHFLRCLQQVKGLSAERNLIRYQDRLVKVDVFPISIDVEKFRSAAEVETVVQRSREIRERAAGRQIIFSVDRLDYTKGVQHRLKAYACFLKKYPEFQGKVVFYLTVVPSRDNIPQYAQRKRLIEELIGNINGELGNLHWQPVLYQYQSLQFEEMVALYTAADLALITPLRDGMNLVAKEFVASRADGRGVLVLSEMAGAARELCDALIINPNDTVETADKILEALTMDESEQERRMVRMQNRVAAYDVCAWAGDFLQCLQQVKQKQARFQETFLDDYSRILMLDQYRRAKKRLLLLDYDGTLVPFRSLPEKAVPGEGLRELLAALGSVPGNDVVVISGRRSSWLEEQFANLPIHLVAEHGARVHWYGTRWITQVQTHSEWKGHALAIMDSFARRCPESFLEEKEFSVVWHYRNSDHSLGLVRAEELKTELQQALAGKGLDILEGNMIIEVRNRGIDKGTAIRKILEDQRYDFIFAAGDDRTDEDMFRTLVDHPGSHTVKVGAHASYAHFNLLKPQMLVALLEHMRQVSPGEPVIRRGVQEFL